MHNYTIDCAVLQQGVSGLPSVLLDCKGREWGRFQLDRRKFVSLEDIPDHVVQAFLAAEDRNFFHHPGISFRGIVRSVLVNLYHRRKVQGASTITQQLVRLLFFDYAKTFRRKIKEQLFSILVERQCTKEQILEAYLNNVYFGYGIYGVQAAAQRFWNKDIQEVSVEQAGVLASVMRSPQHYSPIHAPLSVQKRRNVILKTMHELGFISLQEYQESIEQDVWVQDVDNNVIAAHLKETIRIQLEDFFGKQQLYVGGLQIQTTVDIDVQQAAQQAFDQQVEKLKKGIRKEVDGALISLDPVTGEIRAMIGGYSFKSSKFNRALQAHRQMGSVFKPIVYTAALLQGASFCDVEIDEPFELVQGKSIWAPENNTNQFMGPITRARALSYSNNIVTIKTLLQAGIESVINLAKKLRISGEMYPYPSLALGCVDVTLLQVLGAFNVFANNGKYVEPYYILWVKNQVGQKVYKYTPVVEQVLSSKIAGQVAHVLTFGIKRLQKVIGQKWFGGQAISKTGTTNDSRTCWFCGATPDLTTAMYVGCDYNYSMGNKVYASKTAFPIWFNMHKQLPQIKQEFYFDPSLQEVTLNWKTGKSCEKSDQNSEIVTLLI